MPRRTIAGPQQLTGVGLHTGATTTTTLHPAAAGRGVVFRRTDLPGRPEVPARLEYVQGTERRTALGKPPATIHTVEHLLAAVLATGVDDLVVELDGPEPPILDGSFLPWLELLAAAGTVEHPGEAARLVVERPFTVEEGESRYVVAPAKGFQLTTTIEWDHPLIGRQSGSYDITTEGFRGELAAARTFGFLHEVEALRAEGLIRGASTSAAVVLDAASVVETALRWPDEFVRHKAGDIVGDLALLGCRLEAHVIATRPSHRGNIALGRALQRQGRRSGMALDVERIMAVIPHRYPMLLVDRILEVQGAERVIGIKNVTINEPFFQGHFPGHPIMPGVLIVEAMAQVGGLLLMDGAEASSSQVVYFMTIDKVKFRRPVVPGDQLRFEVDMIQHRGRTCRMAGVAYVDGVPVAEAEFMARLVDR